MNIVFLNGPPGSGKSEVGKILQQIISDEKSILLKFAEPLDTVVRSLFPFLNDEEFAVWREEKKDSPFLGKYEKSLRQIYIHTSEQYIKKLFGETYFAECAYAKVMRLGSRYETMIFTDSGFQSEYDHIYDMLLGHKDITTHLVQVHRDGHTFEGDSRQWVEPKYVVEPLNRFYNDGDLEDLPRLVKQMAQGLEII